MTRSVAVALSALMFLTACTSGTEGEANGRLRVIASFYPLAFVAERVGGDRITLDTLTPSGVEPHDLELASSQIRDLAEADLVVYLGGGFQPAVEDALEGLDGVDRLDVLQGRELIPTDEVDEGADPHVWLDPTALADVVEEVARRLGDADPGHRETFDANAQDLRRELMDLDAELESGLASCGSREFVTSHSAFGYLAARYDLEQVSVSGIDPESEPSPQQLAEVAEFVRRRDIEVVFFEELAPPDLAETLARETGAETDVLSPLEGPPTDGDYIDEMRRNLSRLRGALDCA